MDCPFCGSNDTQVKDSRPCEDGAAIRRRRFCGKCEARFTTFERIHLRDLVVIKSDGSKEVLDRDKLERSFKIALQKREVDPEIVSRSINELIRSLEQQGESEVTSKQIGEMVMEVLSQLDNVAYVRYASVYRNFGEAKDFGTFVKKELGEQ